ncbi:MFS transporter [Acidiphilium sp. PA]|uniref:MFS transporter n=1 Tax=Acidiphilium sp. PA TaxID=2871705 RepID=UPI002243FE31|nr:MFS transporter [Acidiphilium sp. PA]MCW8305746.1 MFS transporter [Acidiphilium sp. PA]
MDVASSNPTAAPTVSRTVMILGASIGNALEFYDFFIYGFFATDLATAFFPGHDATTKLLLTFGTFGVSFLARPVGAVILGAFADRRGRTACMILAVSLMTLASALITVMPPRATIGLLAPLGILLARLIQGFALGGEFGSATALMIEHSPGRESHAASWQGTSQNVAGLCAAAVAYGLSLALSNAAFAHWGFRIAFALGTLAGPVAIVLRRRLVDAPGFIAQQHDPAEPPVREPSTAGGIAIAAGMVAIGTAQTYLIVYLPTYAATQLHMTQGKALGAIVLLYIATLAIVPLRLLIARRFDTSHRSRDMIISCIAMMAAGYPAFILLGIWPGAIALFLIPLTFTIIGLPYNAPLTGFMGMVFPIRHRGIGLSVGYAIGIALFGGFAPFINTWLIAQTGDPRSPGLYLALASIITIAAITFAKARLPPAVNAPAGRR